MKLLYSALYTFLLFTSANAVVLEQNEVCVKNITLKSDAGRRYLDVCIVTKANIESYILKHNIILVYSKRNLEELQSSQGKREAATELQSLSNIKQIYYTNFYLH